MAAYRKAMKADPADARLVAEYDQRCETRDGAWYAGGITTIEARDCELDTSFLGGGEWKAEIFRDAGDAKEDAQKYVHETRKVKAGEHLPFHMAPGGGFVIRFSK